MTAEHIDKLAVDAHRFAQEIIARGEEVTPFVCAITSDGRKILAQVPQYGEPEKKEPLLQILREQFRKEDVTDYVFVMEAWVSEVPPEELQDHVMPSKDPKHRDTLTLVGADNSAYSRLWVVDIKTVDGKRSVGDLPEASVGSALCGPISALLYTPTSH